MTWPLVTSRALGGLPLGRAAASGKVPEHWYPPRPRSAAEWRARIDAVRGDQSLAEWAATLAPAMAASGAAAARLERAATGHGIVVTTGQQPGLFGGPVYTWSKAISALAFADALEKECGVPVAPIFWAATDDADFEEARSTLVAVPGGVDELALPDPDVRGRPMADTPLGDVAPLIERLSSGAGSVADAGVMDAVRTSYGDPSVSVGAAYVRLLRLLLEPLGIAVLDASHPAVRQAMRPLLLRALERNAEVSARLEARSAEIRAAGFEPQVDILPDLTLVSSTDGGTKERVHRRRAAEVVEAAERGSLGPNVLLRPVAERAILPTVAYLAGPGEIAYFAQVGAAAEGLAAEAPLALPRWSGTIVEPHIGRILTRHGIAPDELAHENAVEMRLARSTMPAGVRQAIEELRNGLERSMRSVSEAAIVDGRPLVDPRVPEGARIAMAQRIDRLERRLTAAVVRRSEDMARDIATARAALYPRGKPQERVLNFLPMLARQGRSLLDAMLAAASRHAGELLSPDEPAGPGHRPAAAASSGGAGSGG